MEISDEDKATIETFLTDTQGVVDAIDQGDVGKPAKLLALTRLRELLAAAPGRNSEAAPMGNMEALDAALLNSGALRKIDVLKDLDNYTSWRDRNIALASLRGVQDKDLVPFLLVHLSPQLFDMTKNLNWTSTVMQDRDRGLALLDQALGVVTDPLVSKLKLRNVKQGRDMSIRQFAAEVRTVLERSGIVNTPQSRDNYNREAMACLVGGLNSDELSLKIVELGFSDFDEAIQYCLRHCEAKDARRELRAADFDVGEISAAIAEQRSEIDRLKLAIPVPGRNNSGGSRAEPSESTDQDTRRNWGQSRNPRPRGFQNRRGNGRPGPGVGGSSAGRAFQCWCCGEFDAGHGFRRCSLYSPGASLPFAPRDYRSRQRDTPSGAGPSGNQNFY